MKMNLKQVQIRRVFTKSYIFLVVCRAESLQTGLVPLCKISVLVLLKELTNTSYFRLSGPKVTDLIQALALTERDSLYF